MGEVKTLTKTLELWKLGGEKKVSTVFEILNREAGHHGVTDWALGQTSLDDVFAFIVQKYNK